MTQQERLRRIEEIKKEQKQLNDELLDLERFKIVPSVEDAVINRGLIYATYTTNSRFIAFTTLREDASMAVDVLDSEEELLKFLREQDEDEIGDIAIVNPNSHLIYGSGTYDGIQDLLTLYESVDLKMKK